jgi:5-methylcytosine-specific restriction endonuclease McrA
MILSTIEYKTLKQEVFERDDFRCVICGRPQSMVELIIHFKRPLTWNGTETIDNALTVCRKHSHSGPHYHEALKIWGSRK